MKINCMKCKHFYVTWDPQSPKGCRVYQFKSPSIPSQVVLAETGSPCQSFEEKHPQEKPVDLNDEKYW